MLLIFFSLFLSQGRMPFVRTMSMEQRWQDLANLLSLPGQEGVGMHHPFAHHPHHPHHHHHANYPGHNYSHDGRGVLLHNATLPPAMGELNNSGPYSGSAAMGKFSSFEFAIMLSRCSHECSRCRSRLSFFTCRKFQYWVCSCDVNESDQQQRTNLR